MAGGYDTSTTFNSGNSGGGSNFMDYLSQMAGGGGSTMGKAAGVAGDVGLAAANPLAFLGSKLGGALFKAFAPDSQKEKDRKRLFDYFEGMKNKNIINPNVVDSYAPKIEQSLIPWLNQMGSQRASRTGMGSGVGLGEVMQQGKARYEGSLLPFLADIDKTNAMAKMQFGQMQSGLV